MKFHSNLDGPASISDAHDGADIQTTRVNELDHPEQVHDYADLKSSQQRLDIVRNISSNELKESVGVGDPLVDDSPYEEVRVAIRNTDGCEMACTVRAWMLGIFFVTTRSGLNIFLGMRTPAISIPNVIAQLLAYPFGCFLARVMPFRKFNFFGLEWSLNPGPFTIKEHTVITLMSSLTFTYAHSTDVVLVLQAKQFYNRDPGWAFPLLFVLSAQLVGISLAGLFRRLLVWPAAMKWPLLFSRTILFYTLHQPGKNSAEAANGWRISRYSWFCLATLGMFIYYWLPGVIFQGLSVFSFLTWIKPNNVVINQLFGGFSGLSLIPITFDWSYVTVYLGNPLLAPTSAHVNTLVGLACAVIIPVCGIVYSGALWSKYLPMVSNQVYDNTQRPYKVAKILGSGFTFNKAMYESYSPLFLPPALALNYGLSFAGLASSIVHVGIYHGKEMWHRLRAARNQEPDIHLRLMTKYSEVPDWWYAALLLISLAMGLAAILGFDSQLPWWAFLVAILISLIFMIPTSIICAMSTVALSLNVISPFLAGFMIPGRPIGVMIFKAFATSTLGQAQLYASDLKLGQYMKIPPKVTFWSQVVPAVWAALVQILVLKWTLGNVENVCDVDQKNHFNCPNGRAYFASSLVWGVVGPERMFGRGGPYAHINWLWLIGAALPLVLYFLVHVAGVRFFRHFNAPIIFGSVSWLPPATPVSFGSWAIVGLVFNRWVRRRWHDWWSRYNYITAAALDSGVILSTIFIFFALFLPGVPIPQWWGNVAVAKTLDARHEAVLKTVPPNGTFGPETWK